MKRKWQYAVLVLVMALVPVFAACSNDSSSGENGKPEQSITLNAASEPPTLDPALATDTTSGWVIHNLFEGLYTKDQKGNIVKGVAEKVEKSNGKKTWTFTIRDDAKWSDGNPVTAQDFEYEWKRVLNPDTGSAFAFYLYYIKGAEAYNKGKGSADDVAIKALDDKTLEVTLAAPTPYFEKLLAFWTYYPVEKSVVENNKNWAASPDKLASNGAYKLTEWKHNSQVVVEKNDNYWNKDTINMNKITWKVVNDANTYYQMFKSGELDLITDLPTDVIAQEKDSKEFKQTPYFGTYMYMFNVNKEPFNNQKVRKAFNLALDREKITEQVSQGGEKPAYAFVPYGVKTPSGDDFRKQKEAYFKKNVEKAKQLIEEAKQEEGWSKLPKVTLMYNTSDGNKKIAEAVQQMLVKNLGVDVDLQNQEWKTYLATTKQQNFQMARMGWIGIFQDPVAILDYYLGDSPNNRTGWVNKQYDKLIAQSKVEQDPKKRFEELHQAEDILMKELPFMPVYYYSMNYLQSQDYEGVVYRVNRYPDVRWAKKVK